MAKKKKKRINLFLCRILSEKSSWEVHDKGQAGEGLASLCRSWLRLRVKMRKMGSTLQE